jgi:hypothetical protein
VSSNLMKVWVCAGLVAFSACGAPIKSVAQFGASTDNLADSIEVTARGGAEICEHKRSLAIDEKTILGTQTAKQALDELNKDGCKRFRDTAAFYDALARQLGAFGLAMKTLAEGGEADYTQELTGLSQNIGELGLNVDQQKIDAAGGLVAKLLSWFAQGYSSKKISQMLEESNADVKATLELLDVVLQAYDEQLNAYAQVIGQVSEDQAFATGANEVIVQTRKVAQTDLVQAHATIANDRKLLLAASHQALQSVSKLHEQLVAEAQRKKEEFDVPQLLAQARQLHRDVLAFRSLALEASR